MVTSSGVNLHTRRYLAKSIYLTEITATFFGYYVWK